MKYEKTIKNYLIKTIITVSLGVICISCTSNQENVDLILPSNNYSKELPNEEKSPSETVEMFMKFVEQNKEVNAMNLFIENQNSLPKGIKVNMDKTPKFNWAKSLYDRNLSLKKILEENIEENQAFVKVELFSKDLPNISHVCEFQMIQKGNEWKLSTIKMSQNE